MRSGVVHEPPPDSLVVALVHAGVSRNTALAMEQAKAIEVLSLLRSERLRHDLRERGPRS
jgi:predicted protein tyrosine phosphatase